ncbi:hypothetical protein [Brumimicrobium glaciale]|uniref:hypothetical protein n=1 Tax=Brumimicrobium glaciale TaxID=200475 RepID=UPI001F5D9249|nr:hypothetical protein [Brumimicrobium glaciale]
MIERVLHPHNVQRALKQVIANKGSAGVDRLSVNELTESFRKGKTQLYSSIMEMEYLAQPILGVEPSNELMNTNKNRQEMNRFLKEMVKHDF